MNTKYMLETNLQSELEIHAQDIVHQNGFIPESSLQFGTWYDGIPRSLVYAGTFQGQSAVLKVYNESRAVNQPENLLLFAKSHTSARMHVPALYGSAVESPQAGWMIMEFVPQQATVFQSPIQAAERATFLQAFFEYRSHFSVSPLQSRDSLDPQYTKPDGGLISSSEFHVTRIHRWRALALATNTQHVNDSQTSLLSEELMGVADRALRLIEKRFLHEPLYWCHGHFKPNEIHIDQATGNFWITDFGHMTLFPRGYEFAFMIWADALMEFTDGEKMISYEEYRQRVVDWVHDYQVGVRAYLDAEQSPSIQTMAIAKSIQLESDIQMAALLERILGTIYADTIARVEIPYEEKQHRVELLHQLMVDILDNQLLTV